MRKSHINTISIREIKSSFKRFITIVLMSLLGVGTFVGLSATAPDMINSLDKYYDKQDFYDIKILSTLGISENMINTIKNIDGVESISGSYSNDYVVNIGDKETIVKIMSIPESINKIELLDGELPKEKNEILLETLMLENLNVKIGDYISYENENKSSVLKVVGEVKSPIYITGFKAMPDRGNTNIGTGKINFYGYADSAMVKGIVAIILSMVEGKSLDEIKNMDMESEFKSLNLNFGASRLNGIHSMINFFKKL